MYIVYSSFQVGCPYHNPIDQCITANFCMYMIATFWAEFDMELGGQPPENCHVFNCMYIVLIMSMITVLIITLSKDQATFDEQLLSIG